MIQVTRINKVDKFWVNENLIEFMEETPDTILAMVSGKKYAIAETAEEVENKIISVQKAALVTRDSAGEMMLKE